MRIITIIGARPQFVKAAVVSDAIRAVALSGVDVQESILHTGQHYDDNMSELFFRQLHIPSPRWHLACGNDYDLMRRSVTSIMEAERPDRVIVYGDTLSTLAGAEAAQSLHIPIAHIEAGLRSFNTAMPEEHNRIITDRLSTWLFCPTKTAVENLHREGFTEGIFHSGDVMYDAVRIFTPQEDRQLQVLAQHQLSSKQFVLATMHRADTADNVEALTRIITALKQLEIPVLLPLHPHTAKTIHANKVLQQLLDEAGNIRIISPVGYIETLSLERHARFVLTDSGGMQKEAYFQRTPCVTMRDETEWVETVRSGWNHLAGTTTEGILRAMERPFEQHLIHDFGDGHAAQKIARIICQSEY